MSERAIGLVPPSPNRLPHPCNDMAAQVHVGEDAYMTIVNPWCENNIEWQLRYGNPETVRYVAASLLDTFDYLLSGNINMAEATRRLRLMRQARKELREQAILGRERQHTESQGET